MSPAEWGHVGLGGVLSATITAIGAYLVKRADKPRPTKVEVAQVEAVTKGLGDLVDDLQAERKELRHINRNLRMELNAAYEKAARSDAALARSGQILALAEVVIGALEKLAASTEADLSPAISSAIATIREARRAQAEAAAA